MANYLVFFLIATCFAALAAGIDFTHHDYDVQIHPTHGHGHGYHDHGFATSIRYDKRYHYKIPAHVDDSVYHYVIDSDDLHHYY